MEFHSHWKLVSLRSWTQNAYTGEALSISNEDITLLEGGHMEQGDLNDGTLVEA